MKPDFPFRSHLHRFTLPQSVRHGTAILLLTAMTHATAAPQPSALGANWTMYNKGFDGQRFSDLDQINAQNAGALAPVCRIKLAKGGSFHTGPLVIDGVMYVTTARLTVAINARNCELLWRAVYVPEQQEGWSTNRGAAFANGRLYRGTADGRLLALDAKTGKLLWKTVAADSLRGEFLSSAPIVSGGLIYLGVAGGDWGIRGRMMAFDASSGRQVWRFNTIPMPGEPGAETWQRPETMETGGGGTWSSYAFDAERNEVFVPVANPAPDFSPAYRPGANLYSNSVLALDARTGKLKWYYQLAPNDGHDYGVGAAPMLYRQKNGTEVVTVAAKDGFVYAIDRNTHRLLFKTPVTTIENAGLPPTPEGRRFCPGAYGGTEWNGPAFDRQHHALVVGAVDWCAIIKSEAPQYVAGRLYMGGGYKQLMQAKGWVTSLDADSGKVNWKYQADAPVVAGVTPTAGGVVFTGDMSGNFLALDSHTGRLLYKFATGGAIAGGVVSYAVEGKQYVATTSGNTSRATFGALGAPTIVILALPDGAKTAPRTIDISQDGAGEVPEYAGGHGRERSLWEKIVDKFGGWRHAMRDKVTQAKTSLLGESPQRALARGKTLFAANCIGCHGTAGEGLAGPSLQRLQDRMSPTQIAHVIEHPKPPMPALYPSILSQQDVKDLAAFLHTL